MRPSIQFRPTPAQAVAGGVHTGLLAGTVGSAVALLTGWGVGGLGWLGGIAALLPMATGVVLGVALGLRYGRDQGTDADETGLWSVPQPLERLPVAAWRSVADLRRERRGGRIQIAVYLHDGRSVRLPAPYDGRLFAADPAFERKLVTLRHLWEKHRHARDVDPRR